MGRDRACERVRAQRGQALVRTSVGGRGEHLRLVYSGPDFWLAAGERL